MLGYGDPPDAAIETDMMTAPEVCSYLRISRPMLQAYEKTGKLRRTGMDDMGKGQKKVIFSTTDVRGIAHLLENELPLPTPDLDWEITTILVAPRILLTPPTGQNARYYMKVRRESNRQDYEVLLPDWTEEEALEGVRFLKVGLRTVIKGVGGPGNVIGAELLAPTVDSMIEFSLALKAERTRQSQQGDS